MKFNELNDNNIQLYAMVHYDNPSCTDVSEFHEDISRVKYIKRLLRKYKSSGEIRSRLMFNHLIVLYNVFGIDAATNLLFYKLDGDLASTMKTYLVFLNYYPTSDDYVFLGADVDDLDEIKLDSELYALLKTQYDEDTEAKTK